MNNDQQTFRHECTVKNRAHADITGVKQVISFDENCVMLVTECGEMTLEGYALKVGTLDTERGIIAVDGNISSLYYSDSNQKKHRKLFRRSTD